MARATNSNRRPRIRKSAPTVRQRLEAEREKSESKAPKRHRRVLSKASAPIKKLRLSERKGVRVAGKPFKYLKQGLSWLVPRYLVNSWRELRQVQWPSRRETWRLTLAVFVFAIVFGALVAGVDKGLDEVFKKVVLK